MLAADSNAGHNRHSTRPKSGYEPSDTETEWHDSPWNDAILKSQRTRLPKDPGRDPQVDARRQNISPNRVRDYPDEKTSSLRNNRTPPRVTEQRRHTSPYAGGKNESRKKSSRTPPRFRSSMEKFSRSSIKERISRSRSISTPKLRPHEKEHPSRVPAFRGTPVSTQVERDSIDIMKAGSHAENCSPETNELIANSKGPSSKHNEYTCTSTESTGDIFFSRDCRAPLVKTLAKNNSIDKSFTSDSNVDDAAVTQANSSNLGRTSQFVSVRTGFSRTTNTSYANGRQSQVSSGTTLSRQLNSDRFSGDSGKFSDFTGRLVGGVMKFTSNRQNTRKTDESESTFIRKALVVEKIRLFWADKYRPRALSGFTCHREQVRQLKQLVSPEFCPHIILKGPPGSGKRSLCRAVLTEIFGDSSLNVSHYLKSCNGQGPASASILVPLSSSDHHVELNMRTQSKNARYALTALANEMSNKHKITEISATKNFKVLVLYDVDKVSENNQRLIKWIIDSSSDACKIIMTCQDGPNLLDSITGRCKLITIGVPNTREVVEVLTHISKRESFDIPTSFAATIATRSAEHEGSDIGSGGMQN